MNQNGGYALTSWVGGRWERGTRYYEAYVHQDLWGAWVLTRAWGRRGTRLGRVVCFPCQSYREARDRLAALGRRRKHRGYAAVSPEPSPNTPIMI